MKSRFSVKYRFIAKLRWPNLQCIANGGTVDNEKESTPKEQYLKKILFEYKSKMLPFYLVKEILVVSNRFSG